MKRWLILILIAFFVFSGVQGCVLVVADEEVAQEIHIEHQRSRLARDMEREIARDDSFGLSDIAVSGDHGVVMLRGTVGSLAALQRAVDIAVHYDDVDELVLRLTVAVSE